MSGSPLLSQLISRQTGCSLRNLGCPPREAGQFAAFCEERTSLQFPSFLSPQNISNLENVDKIFASVWTRTTIIVGTKNNQLLICDAEKPTSFRQIELPKGLEAGPNLSASCGIHSICTNPSGTLVASGAYNPAHIALFKIPSFQPLSVLPGHKDWVFGLDFMNEETLISASRDSLIKIWSASTGVQIASKKGQQEKVRDVKCRRDFHKFYSLGTDGTLKSWDGASFTEELSVDLPEKSEAVCISLSPEHGLVAVGTQNQTNLIDMRVGKTITVIPSIDQDWGVRSLSWKSRVITIGAGAGSLAFYDTRMSDYIHVGANICARTGEGWILKDHNYYGYHAPINHAVLTHCFDPSGTRLFVGGGPLMYGLKGAYASIW